MAGYCGRAAITRRAEVAPAAEDPGRVTVPAPRTPAGLLQRTRGLVVRIGPRPLLEQSETNAASRAA